jgi:2-polyprenyl-3-methyl-5-hydroxy-6-metoxy-1,4-benzoquinol methylase
MSTVQDHYRELDAQCPGGGSIFDVAGLLGMRPVARWAAAHGGRRIRILDIGCGTGVFLKAFIEGLANRHGLEAESRGIDLIHPSQNQFSSIPGSFEFSTCDVDGVPLPFKDGAFDFIACNHVIEHVFQTQTLVGEICRVLAPDGLAEISTPNLSCWINRLLLLAGIQPLSTEVATDSMEYGWPVFRKLMATWAPPGHIRCFTAAALEDLCRKRGFDVAGRWRQERRFFYRNIALLLTPRA